MSKEDREAIQKTLNLMMDAIQSIKGEMEQRFSYYDEQILNIKSSVVKLEQGYEEIANNSDIQQPKNDKKLQNQMIEMTSKFQLLKSQLDGLMIRSQPDSGRIEQRKEQKRVVLPKTSSLDSPLKSLNKVKATIGSTERETAPVIEKDMETTLESKTGIKLIPIQKASSVEDTETIVEKAETEKNGKVMNIPPPPSKSSVKPLDAQERKLPTTPAHDSQAPKAFPSNDKDSKQDDKSELMKALKQLESI